MSIKTKRVLRTLGAVIIIVAAVFIQLIINREVAAEGRLSTAMAEAAECDFASEVRGYAFYSNEEYSPDVRKNIVKNLASKMGVDAGYEIKDEETFNGRVTSFSAKDGDYNLLVQLVTFYVDDENDIVCEGNAFEDYRCEGNAFEDYDCENYILIQENIESRIEESCDVKRKIEKCYDSIGLTPVKNIYITGTKKGRIGEYERKKIIENFMNLMNANEVLREDFDGNTVSYGYTEDISEFVYQNSDKVNINIAFSYDENADETRLHMAVPFVDKSF